MHEFAEQVEFESADVFGGIVVKGRSGLRVRDELRELRKTAPKNETLISRVQCFPLASILQAIGKFPCYKESCQLF